VGHGSTILWADGVDPRKKSKNSPGMMAGLDAATGRTLWTGTSENNCAISPDVLVADGLVWTGKLLLWNQPGITEGLDPKTGKVARTREPDWETFNVGMPHHRCYRNKGASKWLILGRAGVEFLNVETGEIFPSHWTRGTCQYGILPANGLLYVPPHACACYLTAKINGFYALRPVRQSDSTKAAPGTSLVRGPAYGEIGENAAAVADSGWPTYRRDSSRSGRTACDVPDDLKQSWKADIGGNLTALTIAGDRCFVADDAHAVHALDAATGRSLWTFTAGGRVDSPPTIADGRAVFGCRDGYIYCIRASDGEPAWRFRAAPLDRRTVDRGRIESLWPVNGSVLVQDGCVFVAAGRSTFLDGGIRLCRLDLKSGELVAESTIYTPDPITHRVSRELVDGFEMAGAQSDVLVSEGETLFMRQFSFDRDLKPAPRRPHLYSPTGLLDDSWWHRTYWLYGQENTSGWSTWFQAGNVVPAGRILAFDDETVFGFGREQYRNCNRGGGTNWAGQERYCMFAARKTGAKQLSKWRPKRSTVRPVPRQFVWMQESPVRARAMVLTPDTVFFAGPPNLGNSSEGALASYQGEEGAKVVAVAVEDGTIKRELDLPAVPVLDGMASAGGRLYLSLKGGTIICLGIDEKQD
jgi:outer membrane protein assembly factor BamB